jgi:deoxyribose-phosphate aldolase
MCLNMEQFNKAYTTDDEEDKKKMFDNIESDIRNIANECHKNGVVLKIIIEINDLTMSQISILSGIINRAGADFIQTSSGKNDSIMDVNKIKEIRRILPEHIKIKAVGGINTLEDANKIYPFVDRIGTSKILK